MWFGVLFQGKWKDMHPIIYTLEQRSQTSYDSKPFLFLYILFTYSTSPGVVRVSCLNPPFYHQANPSSLDTNLGKSISIRVMPTPITWDLRPLQGSTRRTWQGFVCAASVCSVSDANKVLVLRGGERRDPVHLRHNKSSWGVQGGLTCIWPRLWKHGCKFHLSLYSLKALSLREKQRMCSSFRGNAGA